MDGVLGGYPNVSEPDISCSDDFLKILLSERFPSDVTRQPLVALGTSVTFIECNIHKLHSLCTSYL